MTTGLITGPAARRQRGRARRCCRRTLAGQTLRRRAATVGRLDVVGAAHETEAQLVHDIGAEGLCIAEVDQLGPAEIQGCETGDTRSTLAGGIRVVEFVIVEEIVRGQHSQSVRIGIETETAFIVAEDLAV